MFRTLMILLISTLPALGGNGRAGVFDYYVMSLSWTPTWCALEGDRRRSPQCRDDQGFGFTLHGLWPQYSRGGWPSHCQTPHRQPSRNMTTAMADIMGTSGLAWHQWKKHGRCSGLSAADYYAVSRKAYEQINRPDIFRKLRNDVHLPASVVEDAFMEANPKLLQNQITVTCKARKIQEVRICFSNDLKLQKCGPDVIRDCSLRDAGMDAMR